jgi:hypothetical protein
MRKISGILFVFSLALLLSNNVQAQKYNHVKTFGRSSIWMEGYLNLSGFQMTDANSFIRPVELAGEVQKIKANLVRKHGSTAFFPEFIIPLRAKEGFNEESFYVITSYFDHDSLYPDQILDYHCGNLTYDDESGYNHTGTDFFLWPFPWHKMENDIAEVIAVESGLLIYKQDGNFDQHCELNSDAWNGLGIMHDDGTIAWYLHLKANSLTSKPVGEEIEKGEYLGIVGSSGSSTAPHLHFEVLDSAYKVIDPFFGNCNDQTQWSWWEEQPEYKKPGINKICTNNKLPVFPDCPGTEIINEATQFKPGDTIFLMSYFNNLNLNDTVKISIYRPDQSEFASWLWFSPWTYSPASWLYFFMILQDDMTGDWNYSVDFKGKQYDYFFKLVEAQHIEAIGNSENVSIYPNPAYDFIKIRFRQDEQDAVVVDLFNNAGILLKSQFFKVEEENEYKYEVKHLLPGIYFLQVFHGKETSVFRFVKR